VGYTSSSSSSSLGESSSSSVGESSSSSSLGESSSSSSLGESSSSSLGESSSSSIGQSSSSSSGGESSSSSSLGESSSSSVGNSSSSSSVGESSSSSSSSSSSLGESSSSSVGESSSSSSSVGNSSSSSTSGGHSSSSSMECGEEWYNVAGHDTGILSNFTIRGANDTNTHNCKIYVKLWQEGCGDDCVTQWWGFYTDEARTDKMFDNGFTAGSGLPVDARWLEYSTPSSEQYDYIRFYWDGTGAINSDAQIEWREEFSSFSSSSESSVSSESSSSSSVDSSSSSSVDSSSSSSGGHSSSSSSGDVLYVSGDLSPDVEGEYHYYQEANDHASYERVDGGYYIWWNEFWEEFWLTKDFLSLGTGVLWYKAGVVTGDYAPSFGAIGTATVSQTFIGHHSSSSSSS